MVRRPPRTEPVYFDFVKETLREECSRLRPKIGAKQGAQFESSVLPEKFPNSQIPCYDECHSLILVREFPIRLRREFGGKPLNLMVDWMQKLPAKGPESAKFPVIFAVIREFEVETGSHRTASSATTFFV
jgi:hypothetical protein